MATKDYKGNVAAEAWDSTKDAADPTFDNISEAGFKENLEYRAAKVKETGTAITNFEKKVAQILSSDAGKNDSPMAVVAPPAGVDYKAASEGLVEKTAEHKADAAKVDAADAKAQAATDDAAQKQGEATKVKQDVVTKEATKPSVPAKK